jgi:hypothetical protein
MSIVSDSLGILDQARGLLDDVGLRPYRVYVRTRAATGGRVGLGSTVATTTEITVDGTKRPKVRQLSAKEVVAAGGALSDQIFEIGPLTPEFSGGGTDPATLNPAIAAEPTEVAYILVGPGTPENGWICHRISDKLDSPFRYMVTVQRTGVNAVAP